MHEFIDPCNHAADQHARMLGQCLLADRGAGGHLRQHSRLGRSQSNFGNALGKLASGADTQLRKPERGSARTIPP